MNIDEHLKEAVKLLKVSVERMSKQRETLQLEIKRLKDVSVNARERAANLKNEIVALGITADNTDAKIKEHLEELSNLDEEMRVLQAHLTN
jgi:chromosome segregation ATPase